MSDETITDFIRTSRDTLPGKKFGYVNYDGWTLLADGKVICELPTREGAKALALALSALPAALDMLEAQQREAEKWRDARDELARARRRDIDKLERQMDVVAEQLVVALRDGDALRKQLAEQVAEIARLRRRLLADDLTGEAQRIDLYGDEE